MNGPDGKPFVWGQIEFIHSVGPYSIVEYVPTGRLKSAVGSKTMFSVYVDDRDSGLGAATLDKALVLAVAYRHEGRPARAACYFLKMLGMDPDES